VTGVDGWLRDPDVAYGITVAAAVLLGWLGYRYAAPYVVWQLARRRPVAPVRITGPLPRRSPTPVPDPPTVVPLRHVGDETTVRLASLIDSYVTAVLPVVPGRHRRGGAVPR